MSMSKKRIKDFPADGTQLKIFEFKTDPESKEVKMLDKKGKDYLNDGGCDIDVLAQEINRHLGHHVIDKVVPDDK